jgi:hypothetical protein
MASVLISQHGINNINKLLFNYYTSVYKYYMRMGDIWGLLIVSNHAKINL